MEKSLSMNEAKQFLKENPDKKLGEWLDEEVTVKTVEFDPQTKKASVVDKIDQRKVQYIHAPLKKYRCKSGEHVFKVLDRSRYIFGCTKCQYARQAYPTTFKITPEGYMIDMRTNTRV